MAQQTAVEWLLNNIHLIPKFELSVKDIVEQAKQMELERRKKDLKMGYTQGYIDSECNHIHDGDNFANEQVYINNTL